MSYSSPWDILSSCWNKSSQLFSKKSFCNLPIPLLLSALIYASNSPSFNTQVMTCSGIRAAYCSSWCSCSRPTGLVYISVGHMGVTLLNWTECIWRHSPPCGSHSAADQVSVTTVKDYFSCWVCMCIQLSSPPFFSLLVDCEVPEVAVFLSQCFSELSKILAIVVIKMKTVGAGRAATATLISKLNS